LITSGIIYFRIGTFDDAAFINHVRPQTEWTDKWFCPFDLNYC
jgi:hypothetical protein